ncbi:type II CRISPR-associated endonuclease Cas1 [Salinarimonas chemoclinalis]|uniref:type II CRISPR-associated endonuclease Cas1 n=1 Tax=Salinarimonas chemoclinalis TaxID=3241599 RepID=UPI0035562207
MTLSRILEIATPGTRLSTALDQLVIARPGEPDVRVPIEDIGVLVVDDARASYTHAALVALLEAGATVVASGRDHLPLGLLLPLDAHHVQTERHRAQVEAGAPARKRAWQALVRAKIAQQGIVLAHFTGQDAGLAEMARRVRSGDPDNLEAQAAQRYWPRLLGTGFRRDREAEGANALLNYGYAVVRAATARAVVATGLIPSLGVFHKRRSNPFCLADDLVEPYRPFVDWRVRRVLGEGADPPTLDDRATRATLLSVLKETVRVGARRLPLLLALHASAASLRRALCEGTRGLDLPTGLPLAAEDLASDDAEEAAPEEAAPEEPTS